MCRTSTIYTALPNVVATFDVHFITQNENSYDIHMRANLEENTLLMYPKIIATSYYTTKCRSFDYLINMKFCFSVM